MTGTLTFLIVPRGEEEIGNGTVGRDKVVRTRTERITLYNYHII